MGHMLVCVCVVVQSCLTLGNALGCSPPGSSVHGIFLAEILEWVSISFCRGFSSPRDQTQVSCVSCIADRFLTCWATGEAPGHMLTLCQMLNQVPGIQKKREPARRDAPQPRLKQVLLWGIWGISGSQEGLAQLGAPARLPRVTGGESHGYARKVTQGESMNSSLKENRGLGTSVPRQLSEPMETCISHTRAPPVIQEISCSSSTFFFFTL